MKKNRRLILLIVLCVALLAGCSGSGAAASGTEKKAVDPAVTERREAYAEALNNAYMYRQAPDGSELMDYFPEEYNSKFFIKDIDGDDKEELGIIWDPTGSSLDAEAMIYEYDCENKTFINELLCDSDITIYDNGIIESEFPVGDYGSYNYAPHIVYVYDAEANEYKYKYNVSAWEKEYADDMDEEFDSSLDKDGDELLYMVTEEGSEAETMMDNADFEKWEADYRKGGAVLDVEFVDLNPINIKRLAVETRKNAAGVEVNKDDQAAMSSMAEKIQATVDSTDFSMEPWVVFTVIDDNGDSYPEVVVQSEYMSNYCKVFVNAGGKCYELPTTIDGEFSMHCGISKIYLAKDRSTLIIESFYNGGSEESLFYYTEIYKYDGKDFTRDGEPIEGEWKDVEAYSDMLGDDYSVWDFENDKTDMFLSKEEIINYLAIYNIEIK